MTDQIIANQIENDDAYEWLLANGEEDESAIGRASLVTRSRPDEVLYALAVLPKSEYDMGYGSIMTDSEGFSLLCGGGLRDVMTHVWTGDGWQQMESPVQLSDVLLFAALLFLTDFFCEDSLILRSIILTSQSGSPNRLWRISISVS